MDGHQFDFLVKALATQTSRRRLLRGFGGSAIAGMLSLLSWHRAHAQDGDDDCPTTVGICHRTGSRRRPFVFIEVCADAVPAHAAHGDLVACPGAGVIDPEACTCVCPLTEDDCPGGVDAVACACRAENVVGCATNADCPRDCPECILTTEGRRCVNGVSVLCPPTCGSSADCPETHPVCVLWVYGVGEVCPWGPGGCGWVGGTCPA